MPLSDYAVTRDHFRPDPCPMYCFPCSACIHKFGAEDNEPCSTCDHNAGAVPESLQDRIKRQEKEKA